MTATIKAYQAVKAAHWSTLKYLAVSPKEYRYQCQVGRADTPAMRLGRALHALLPTRTEYDAEWAVYPGAARRGAAWEDFASAHEGQEILIRSEAEVAENMALAVQLDSVARPYLEHGERERAVQWQDRETGLRCKGRIDLLNGRLTEFKSTSQLGRFPRQCATLGYHGQVAFYLDGLRAAGYDLTDEPVMIVVQSAPPWDVVVYRLPETFIAAGRTLYRYLLSQLKECLDRDEWPGRADGEVMELELPAWAESQQLTIDGEPVEL